MGPLETLIALLFVLLLVGFGYAIARTEGRQHTKELDAWWQYGASRGVRFVQAAWRTTGGIATFERFTSGLLYQHVGEVVHYGVRMTLTISAIHRKNVTGFYAVERSWRVDAFIEPQLDLGLWVEAARFRRHARMSPTLFFPTPLADWLHERGLGQRGIGDPELDRWYRIGARDEDRLGALLNPEVRKGLLLATPGAMLRLNDGVVTIERASGFDAEAVDWTLQHAAWMVQALRRTASQLPPSPEALAYLPAYEHAARTLGFRYTASPAALYGQLDGVQVSCSLVPLRQGEPPAARLRAAIPEPLGLGLTLRPAQDGGLGLGRPRDLPIGDALLDDKLDIHASDPLGVQVVFDARARALLHHLRDRGCIYADDHYLQLEARGSVQPHDLLPTLRALRDLAAALSEGARARRSGVVRAGHR